MALLRGLARTLHSSFSVGLWSVPIFLRSQSKFDLDMYVGMYIVYSGGMARTPTSRALLLPTYQSNISYQRAAQPPAATADAPGRGCTTDQKVQHNNHSFESLPSAFVSLSSSSSLELILSAAPPPFVFTYNLTENHHNMCKIGIVAIGIDLYISAFQLFQTLILILQNPNADGSYSSSSKRIILDLIAHMFALMTLVQTFRGRVNRQAAGRIVMPVLAVKVALDLDKMMKLQQQSGDVSNGQSSSYGLVDTLMIAKTALFLFITAKLAFGKDKSYISQDEWFPKKKKTC